MAIIGQSVEVLEEITTECAAPPASPALGSEGDLRKTLVAPALRVPAVWGTGEIPDRVGTGVPGKRKTGCESSEARVGSGTASLARLADVPEVWNHLPGDVPRRLRERLLVMARRFQQARLHFRTGGFE